MGSVIRGLGFRTPRSDTGPVIPGSMASQVYAPSSQLANSPGRQRENVLYFFVSPRKLIWHWTQNGLSKMTTGHMEQSKVARWQGEGKKQASSLVYRRGGAEITPGRLAVCVNTQHVRVLGQTVCVAGAPWSGWLPPLDPGPLFSGLS